MTCIWPITNWAWVGWRHANHTKCGYMSDEINDKNDDGTNVADAVSPSGEIEVLDIKRADSSSGRNGGKGGRGQADGACGGEDRRRRGKARKNAAVFS